MRFWPRFWPRGLMGQVMSVLLVAILLEFMGSAILYERFGTFSSREEKAEQLAEQIMVMSRLLVDTPTDSRAHITRKLSSDHLSINWAQAPVAMPVQEPGHGREQQRAEETQRLWNMMVQEEPALVQKDLRLVLDPAHAHQVQGSVRLADGSYLNFSTRIQERWDRFYQSLFSLSILIIGVLTAAALVIRVLGSPLRVLASAADAAGHGTPVMIAERGSRDLRMLAKAFNAMQVRISELIDSRTKALAAVGHDLRTPLARLRLRTELVDDAFARSAMTKDIDEMEKMLNSVLTYLAGEKSDEPRRLVDIATLTMTVTDDAADMGQPVIYEGPDSLTLMISPLRVKRAIGNLVENAVKYGDRAFVTLYCDDEGVHLVVEDEGPGIPDDMLVTVLEPFLRLDHARPRNTDGLGLGLPIVHQVMQREGGELRLSNRVPHGLRAEMFFPQTR
ncbi:MAG: HAMP domain-containing protein [Sphingobium sp.]|nr:HAMP domain-containing protein [Sphingobium sp.]